MAKAEDGSLIDPFHGKRDLESRTLRHVSEAFSEDPVRILRVARFAARFGFQVAEATMDLMRKMVKSGEADFLVPERVWQEFSKGLMEEHPQRMFEVMEAAGLRERLLPELETQPEVMSGSLAVRFALLCWALAEDEVETLCRRLRVPNEPRELALLVSRNREALEAVASASPEEILKLLKASDAFRRPERFAEMLEVARLAAHGTDFARLEKARAAAAAVDAGAIAAKASGADIARLVDEARLKAIAGD
jgi:tRNA nucleotidyltransferase (CCA-adding enzyme)